MGRRRQVAGIGGPFFGGLLAKLCGDYAPVRERKRTRVIDLSLPFLVFSLPFGEVREWPSSFTAFRLLKTVTVLNQTAFTTSVYALTIVALSYRWTAVRPQPSRCDDYHNERFRRTFTTDHRR